MYLQIHLMEIFIAILIILCSVTYYYFNSFKKKAKNNVGFGEYLLELLKEKTPRSQRKWWETDSALSDDERKILNYFYYISHELRSNDAKRGEIFAMKGGKKQLGFTSIRYHLGFCGYASAVACAKLSAYPSHIKEILSALIEHMLDYSVWCYSVEMWPEVKDIFTCEENIMYLGHLFQLVVTYEMMTGDSKYRTEGFETTGYKEVYGSDTMQLAKQLRHNMDVSSGCGLRCEPGLVFFCCNDHPHIGLKMLENMGLIESNAEYREKFEDWSMRRFAASFTTSFLPNGIFKMCENTSDKKWQIHEPHSSIPAGHLGLDGWCLSYFFPWCENLKVAEYLYYEQSQKLIDWSILDRPYKKELDPLEYGCENGMCVMAAIPMTATLGFVASAAAQAGDSTNAERISKWLRENVWMEETIGGKTGAYLKANAEWQIGQSAQYLMGCTHINSDFTFRDLVDNPLPRDFFSLPYVESIEPAVEVYKCTRKIDEHDEVSIILEIKHPKDVNVVVVRLANTSDAWQCLIQEQYKEQETTGKIQRDETSTMEAILTFPENEDNLSGSYHTKWDIHILS